MRTFDKKSVDMSDTPRCLSYKKGDQNHVYEPIVPHVQNLRCSTSKDRVSDEGDAFFCRLKTGVLVCSHCNSNQLILKGNVDRQFRMVPVGTERIFLHVPVQRVLCLRCGSLRQVRLPFADPKKHYTRSFARYALALCRHMTILDVARHLGVSWDVIKEIQKEHLKKRYSRPKLKHLRRIAIDEISIGKGHRYLTVVLDLESGAVVFVGEGKGADALDPFWKRLRSSGAKIEAVAIDMSPAYIEAVSSNLPGAWIVYDRFHLMKLYNDKLSDLRREVFHEATDKLQKNVIKGSRWLLLKNPENLDPDKEAKRLNEMLALNQPLATAYYMREELRQMWEQEDVEKARTFLESWCNRAETSGIRMLVEMAKTVLFHRWGILAWYGFPISTAALEGTNNKIKTMQRQAYGFRDREFFMLKIYAIHEARYALVG
jgi:transposase